MGTASGNRQVIRFLTEYSGLGGSTRMIVHLAALLAERNGAGIEIHYREHGDSFLESFVRHRFSSGGSPGILPAATFAYPSTGTAVEGLLSGPSGGPIVAHLPYDTARRDTLRRLRSASSRVVLWNLEIPSRHGYGDGYPDGTTVVYLSGRQLEGKAVDRNDELVRIPAPFEVITRRQGKDARMRAGAVGMASVWSVEKGISESFAGFRASGARRLRFWTSTTFRRKARYWVRDRRFRFHAPVLDLSEMYSRFNCLLHLQPHSMGESNVIRDCLSIGTPCVLSKIEGHRRYEGLPGVILVERTDPGKVAGALERALADEPGTRPALCEAYRPHLPDNSRIVSSWEEVLGLTGK